MKFYQLSIGQRFELEGKQYIKTTPLIACLESDGSQKLIKRAVQVRVLGDKSGVTGKDDVSEEYEKLLKIINQYHEEALAILVAHSTFLDKDVISQLENAFTSLKDELISEYVHREMQ